MAGAEVTRSLESDETVFALGYGKRLASGALAKVRLESTGVTSLLYEQVSNKTWKSGEGGGGYFFLFRVFDPLTPPSPLPPHR